MRKSMFVSLIGTISILLGCLVVQADTTSVHTDALSEKAIQEIENMGIDVTQTTEFSISEVEVISENSPTIYGLQNDEANQSEMPKGSVLRIKNQMENDMVKEDLVYFLVEDESGNYQLASPRYGYTSNIVFPDYYDIVATGGIYYSVPYIANNYYYQPNGCAVGVKRVKAGTCVYIEGYLVTSGSKYTYPGMTSLGGGEYHIMKSVNYPVTGQLYYTMDDCPYVFEYMGGPGGDSGMFYTVGFRMLNKNMQYYSVRMN